MPIEKWKKFEASFEGNPNIEFVLEVRQGSKPYIELPNPHGFGFGIGEFSIWAIRTVQQLVWVTGKAMDAGISARNREGRTVKSGAGMKLRQRFSPERTPFQEIRVVIERMDPEERAMWVKAVAIEEGLRTKGMSDLPYAWNRVASMCDEATDLEATLKGEG